MSLKSGRPRPAVYTPERRRARRAAQAGRAILAGRNRERNWERIERHLGDEKKTLVFAGMLVPEEMVARLWPEPPVEAANVAPAEVPA